MSIMALRATLALALLTAPLTHSGRMPLFTGDYRLALITENLPSDSKNEHTNFSMMRIQKMI